MGWDGINYFTVSIYLAFKNNFKNSFQFKVNLKMLFLFFLNKLAPHFETQVNKIMLLSSYLYTHIAEAQFSKGLSVPR